LLHEKCNRKEELPQIEKVTQKNYTGIKYMFPSPILLFIALFFEFGIAEWLNAAGRQLYV
jgi:hypothetical protein